MKETEGKSVRERKRKREKEKERERERQRKSRKEKVASMLLPPHLDIAGAHVLLQPRLHAAHLLVHHTLDRLRRISERM